MSYTKSAADTQYTKFDLAALKTLHKREAHLTLCNPRTKGCFKKGYQHNPEPLTNVLAHKGPVGILPASISCVVFDVDKGGEEAVTGLTRMLGAPLVTTPSKTAGRYHVWYLADDGIKDGDWALDGRAPKNGEIRSTNNLVLWHPGTVLEALEALDSAETRPLARPLARLAPADVDRVRLNGTPTTPGKVVRGVSNYDRAKAYKDQDWAEGGRNNLLNSLVYACGLANDEKLAREILAWYIAEGHEKESRAVATYESGWGDGQAARDVSLDAASNLSPEGVHQRWMSENGPNWRYLIAGANSVGMWHRYDGARWEHLSDGYQFQDAKRLVSHVVRKVAKDAGNKPAAVNRALAPLRRPNFVADVVKFNSVECLDHIEDYDNEKLLLNTPGGVLDLETDELASHDPSQKFRKVAGATPQEGECSVWLQCLDDWTGGDAEMIDYLQRLVGYSLRGDNEAHAVIFVYGAGANGKSVFLKVLQALHGDYSGSVSHRVFIANRFEDHPTELASLVGARLAAIPEVPVGARFNEELLKRASGGEEVTARFMRQDSFSYTPDFLPLIIGNNEPSTRDVGESMIRRLKVIPFNKVIPPEKRDPGLFKKLACELGQIMAWAVVGHNQYLERGLAAPGEKIGEATRQYMEDNDRIGRFLEERTIREGATEEDFVDLGILYTDYVREVVDQGERPESKRRFAQDLRNQRGLKTKKSDGKVKVLGLKDREDF